MLTIISFIFVFSLLVFVHELGHFLFARLNGIYVKEFSIGMGPRLYSKQGKETLYSIKALPIGGAVQMEDEQDLEDVPNSFAKKTPLQRFSVVIAGPVMNFVLALLLFFVIHWSLGAQTTTIGQLIDGYPAQISGVQVGDTIKAINGQTISSWNGLVTAISGSETDDIMLSIERDTQDLDLVVPSVTNEETGQRMIGIQSLIVKDPLRAMTSSWTLTVDITNNIVAFIPRLVSGQEPMENVAGPLGIAQIVGDAAQQGWHALLYFTAFISINLGIMNLLPLPALDGGRLIFITFEMVFRRKLKPVIEERIHYVGFIMLLALMVLVLFNDVSRLFRG